MSENFVTKLYGGEVEVKFSAAAHRYTVNGKSAPGVTTCISVLNKPFLIPWAVNTTIEYIRNNMDAIRDGSEMDVDQILYGAGKEAERQKDVAAEIGSAIHKWVEGFIKGQVPEMPEDPRILTGVNSFLAWKEQNNVRFISSERVIYSKKYGYVGTMDMEMEIDGKLYACDLKTGNALYPEVKMQVAAYQKAAEEESGDRYEGRWVLRISKESEEEYMARMAKKNEGKAVRYAIPPYKVFEAVYLDASPGNIDADFEAFLATVRLYQWQKEARKEMLTLTT